MVIGRQRQGKRGRNPIQPTIKKRPVAEMFFVWGGTKEILLADAVHIDAAEIEALRLVDLEDLYQEAAGQSMEVSRGTVWRLLQSGRRKVIRAIMEGRPLIIGGAKS